MLARRDRSARRHSTPSAVQSSRGGAGAQRAIASRDFALRRDSVSRGIRTQSALSPAHAEGGAGADLAWQTALLRPNTGSSGYRPGGIPGAVPRRIESNSRPIDFILVPPRPSTRPASGFEQRRPIARDGVPTLGGLVGKTWRVIRPFLLEIAEGREHAPRDVGDGMLQGANRLPPVASVMTTTLDDVKTVKNGADRQSPGCASYFVPKTFYYCLGRIHDGSWWLLCPENCLLPCFDGRLTQIITQHETTGEISMSEFLDSRFLVTWRWWLLAPSWSSSSWRRAQSVAAGAATPAPSWLDPSRRGAKTIKVDFYDAASLGAAFRVRGSIDR